MINIFSSVHFYKDLYGNLPKKYVHVCFLKSNSACSKLQDIVENDGFFFRLHLP